MVNGSLGSLQMDMHALGGGGVLVCLAHSVCIALHGIGLWDL